MHFGPGWRLTAKVQCLGTMRLSDTAADRALVGPEASSAGPNMKVLICTFGPEVQRHEKMVVAWQ